MSINNKTLKFYGAAYGDTTVTLKAVINGQTVFEGNVPTTPGHIPSPIDIDANELLFTVDNCSLFPSNFGGSYPMSIQVINGAGAVFGDIQSNWMPYVNNETMIEESTIEGNILTVGIIGFGTIQVGQKLIGLGIPTNTFIQSGSGNTWTLSASCSYSGTILLGNRSTGSADRFQPCYNGTPTNSESTPDARSNVQIDGHQQVPPLPKSTERFWQWTIPTGSTISYNFNVTPGTPATP
jgi:hypothetical protein